MARIRLSVRDLMVVVLVSGVLTCLIAPFVQAWIIQDGQERCRHQLREIGVAIHEYNAKYGHFPPAYLADSHGTPMHSWRVLLLEFLDPTLYKAYDFNEPWDGPHNRKLLDRMPGVYACPLHRDSRSANWTNYVAIMGPGTMFPGPDSVTIAMIADGTSNTIMIAETANNRVAWMQPSDLDVARMSFRINDRSRPSISSHDPAGANILNVSGDARRIPAKKSEAIIKALTTIAGAEVGDAGDRF